MDLMEDNDAFKSVSDVNFEHESKNQVCFLLLHVIALR